MTVETVRPAAARRRFNPFAFPSDTAFRFLLMIMSVFAAAVFAFNWIYFALTDGSAEVRRSIECLAQSGPLILETPDPSAYDERARVFGDCIGGINHPKGYAILGGVVAMLLLAVAIYLLMPSWRMRRGGLVPLTAEDAPEVVEELGRLVTDAGLPRAPRFLWNPLNRSPTGLAFGRIGRHYVAMGGGLVMLFYTDRDAFRAVILHELGHLRNRDVDRTYFTMALWYAFVLGAVLPLLLSIADEGVALIVRVLWRLAALVALVYLTRNSVLRSREIYADLRSDTSGGAPGIRRVIAAPGRAPEHPLARLLRLHPEPSERVAALDDTGRLFQVGVWQAFAAGIVLTLTFHELSTLLGFYVEEPLTRTWLAALLVAPFAAAVVALGVWRATFRAVVSGTHPRHVARAGLALGMGALAGDALSFDNLGRPEARPSGVLKVVGDLVGFTPQKGVVSTDLFGPGVLWAVAIVVSMVLFVLWVAAAARLWLRRGGDREPLVASAAGAAAAALVLTVWTGAFFVVYDLSAPAYRLLGRELSAEADRISHTAWLGPHGLYRVVMDPESMDMYRRWPVVLAFVVLWAFPLAATLRAGGMRMAPRWTFLDREVPPAVTTVHVNLRRALLIGLGAGLLAVVACFALRSALHAWVPESKRRQDDFILAFYYWNVALVLIAQALGAAVAAATCHIQRVLCGLLAAFVTGLFGASAIVLGSTAGSCISAVSMNAQARGCPFWVESSFLRHVLQQTLVQGAVAALAAAGIVALAVAIRSRTAGDLGAYTSLSN